MKRIKTERDEQLSQREKESTRINLNNTNELKDLLEKHGNEKSTMWDFLRFSLGVRAPKDEFKDNSTAHILEESATVVE